ncbi:helix-turn-helix transcriptional regulator [Alloalcanivorax xenomutans]|uniref:helix-turn-helix transcriptional regulator n=1 Tax=Alloalcanivorax xenomutans TaxID=1094342 RepID=UPI0009B6BAB7|nr:helix-turn-helix transcriptional regulator [Alloalcanivorax xenomutans]ARB46528.1 transcriptional regulator [Alloalcanivorax xenomutans]
MSGFHLRLKAARKRLGLTQEQLAAELEVTKAAVSAWENDRDRPGFRHLPLLKSVLGISLDELVYGEADGGLPEVPEALFARNKAEEALLRTFRRMPVKRRQALLALMETLD